MAHLGIGPLRLPFGHGQTREAIKRKIVPQAQAFSPAQTFSPAGRPVASSVTGGTVFQTGGGRQFTTPIAPQSAIQRYLSPTPSTITGGDGQAAPAVAAPTSGAQTGQQAAPSTDNISNLLQPVPEQQGVDFDALIAPAIEGLEAAIAPLTAGTEETVRGIEAGRTTQVARTQADIGGQVTGLERAKGKQEQVAESAADEARRQASQLMQGISSRYGRRGSAGIAASEILGSQAMRNIANIRQGLSDAMLQLDDKIQQVKEIGRIQVQDTEDRTRSSIAEARNRLDLQLADIRRQKGELQSNKAQLAVQAMQIFQNTVNNVNAQNAAFKQNLFVKQQQAENNLRLAMQKAQRVASQVPNLGSVLQNLEGLPIPAGTTRDIKISSKGTGTVSYLTPRKKDELEFPEEL